MKAAESGRSSYSIPKATAVVSVQSRWPTSLHGARKSAPEPWRHGPFRLLNVADPAPPGGKVTTAEVIERLQARHPMWQGKWANVVEFMRTDFMAVGTWPSTGYVVHGYEIKASRSDWLAELRDPHKADAGIARCDYWWLAAAPGVVKQLDELPFQWGYIEVAGNDRIIVHREAPMLRPRLAKRYVHGELNREHADREAFAGLARRFAYAEADRRALSKLADAGIDVSHALDAAAILTGRRPGTSIGRQATKNWEKRKAPSRVRRKAKYAKKRDDHTAGW